MKIVRSKIMPLPRKDIDTDLIIPADYLKVTTKTGLGEHVFARLRELEADFPFNLPEYSECKVLVTGENFGCGSSREHAAWALADWGIQVIIAPSFADIFFNNAQKNGILPVVLDASIVEKLMEGGEVEVDLPEQTLKFDGEVYEFDVDPYRKECLIKGMDDFDYLMGNMEAIKAFDVERKKKLYFNLTKLS